MTSCTTFAGFREETFRFLRGITKNNDKAWFDAHRPLYEAGYVVPARAFVAALGPRLRNCAVHWRTGDRSSSGASWSVV